MITKAFQIKIVLFLLIPFSSFATERSLIEFPMGQTEEVKKEVGLQGGKIMVEWPGGMWVRWNNGSDFVPKGTLKPLISSELSNYGDWINQNPEILDEPLECDIEKVEESFFRSAKGTSDSLSGHTVCALFFVNQINSPNPWTIGQQDQVMSNVALNLAWWAEQALLYEKEVSFEIKPYYFDDPVCQVTEDPTTAAGRSWAMEIMTALGYTRGTLNERQLDYTSDLIEEKESDWGFIAYIIRGAGSYRSNAQIFGPSTTVHFPAARSSLVFAHEVGHIFGLRDEYEELAYGTLNWTLHGLENLNADFRNLINAPCIMKTASLPIGLCCYNAVHLAWTQEVEELHILTEPEDAIFKVQYLNTSTNAVFQERLHQGHTILPLGRGQKVKLTGLDSIRVSSGVYTQPIWDMSGSHLVELTADGTIDQIEVQYLRMGDAQSFVEFGDVSTFIPSRKIQGLAEDQSGGIYILSNQGIGYFDGTQLMTFDIEIEVRPGEYITRYLGGNSILPVLHRENSKVIGGSLLANRPMAVIIENGQIAEFYESPQNFRQQGVYTSAVLTESDVLVASFSDGGLHFYHPDGTFQIVTTADGLPHNEVASLNQTSDGELLLAYDGGRTGMSFSGLFVMDPQTFLVEPYSGVPSYLQSRPIQKIKFFREHTTMAVITENQIHENSSGEWMIHTVPAPAVFDIDLFGNGQWLAGTSTGIHFQDETGRWMQRNVESGDFQENFVRAVLSSQQGLFLAGHQNYGLTAYFPGTIPTSADVETPKLGTLSIYPNPTKNSTISIRGLKEDGNYQLRIFDSQGKMKHQTSVNFQSSESNLSLDINLNAGLYFIEIGRENRMYSGAFLVVE
ncbi:MAG: T9SS C-terminal target domain-containing protein [Saprospirales bacterium]|nr:MAG: T9SS C-terminal target domain-containing protein [Saprospirales bacterium]